jgi:hypothetical protein
VPILLRSSSRRPSFSFDCPFQTPLSLFLRFVVGLATPYLRNLRKTFGSHTTAPTAWNAEAQIDLPLSITTVGRGRDLKASITALTSMTPNAIQFPSRLLLSSSRKRIWRAIDSTLGVSTACSRCRPTSTSLFQTWISYRRSFGTAASRTFLANVSTTFSSIVSISPAPTRSCFPIARRSVPQREGLRSYRTPATMYHPVRGTQTGQLGSPLCQPPPSVSSAPHRSDPDLEAVLFMVDMTLGHGNGFSWKESKMTPLHRAWMSHVFLYHAWHEDKCRKLYRFRGELDVPRITSNTVVADCFFIIGLMVGVPFHVNDIPVKDKRLDPELLLNAIH